MVIAGVICLYVAAVAAVLWVATRLGAMREEPRKPRMTDVQCQHCRAFVPAERALWHHAAPECRPCFLERRLHEARSSYNAPKDAA
jgi:hypothetical protein